MIFARMVKYTGVALATAFLALTSAAHAVEDKKDYITGYIGYFDVIRNDYNSAQFGAEYRARPLQYAIRPMFGVNVTTDGSIYGYAGLNWDADLIKDQLYLIPNFSGGFYHKGDGKNLGVAIEFRCVVEVA